MATAAEEAGTMIPGEETPQIDYEAEARKMGWTPIEEFRGDKSHHLDAETFYTRAVEYMPIAKATIKSLSAKIDRMEKDMKRSAEFFSKSEERAYQRALDDIRQRQEAAVEAGDLDAFRAADKEADKLRQEMGSPKASNDVDDEAARAEAFADWSKENRWYATNPALQAYADAQAGIIAKGKGGGFLDKGDLDRVAELVKAKFGDDFPEAFGETAKPKPRPMVDGGGNRVVNKGGKTFADLPPEAKAACDRWVKQGIIKSRDDYVKAYAW